MRFYAAAYSLIFLCTAAAAKPDTIVSVRARAHQEITARDLIIQQLRKQILDDEAVIAKLQHPVLTVAQPAIRAAADNKASSPDQKWISNIGTEIQSYQCIGSTIHFLTSKENMEADSIEIFDVMPSGSISELRKNVGTAEEIFVNLKADEKVRLRMIQNLADQYQDMHLNPKRSEYVLEMGNELSREEAATGAKAGISTSNLPHIEYHNLPAEQDLSVSDATVELKNRMMTYTGYIAIASQARDLASTSRSISLLLSSTSLANKWRLRRNRLKSESEADLQSALLVYRDMKSNAYYSQLCAEGDLYFSNYSEGDQDSIAGLDTSKVQSLRNITMKPGVSR